MNLLVLSAWRVKSLVKVPGHDGHIHVRSLLPSLGVHDEEDSIWDVALSAK